MLKSGNKLDDGEVLHTKQDKRSAMSRHRAGRALGDRPKPPALWNALPAQRFDDGPPIFGQYPKGFLPWAHERICLRGSPDLLHVCSGGLGPETRGIRVDIRPEVHPDVVADGTNLPFDDESFDGVLIDPPYSVEYAEELYGVDYPRPSALLREAARVLRPGRRVGMLHFLVPNPPPGLSIVEIHGVTTGTGYRIRAFTVYQKDDALDLFG